MDEIRKKWIEEAGVPADHPDFCSKIFRLLGRQRKQQENSPIKAVCANEFSTLSRWLDETELQESTAVRNVIKARRISTLLINDAGDLDQNLLAELEKTLEQHLHFLGPNRLHDSVRNEHMLKVIRILRENRPLQRLIKQITRPSSHPMLEQLIRDTLKLPIATPISDIDARRAALSAWLTYLRQSVGSCFATAPAILVQTEQAEIFLRDLNEILSTGRLKRTFGGVEYAVPASHTWGGGDLKKSFFLSRTLEEGSLSIWNSPGMVNAMSALNLFDEDLSYKEKSEKIKEMLLEALKNYEEPGELIVINMEEVLGIILRARHSITLQDLEEYQNRPREMIYTSLLMYSPGSSGGKGKECSLYLYELEIAQNAFKITAENPLLKTWEFTLASFAEIKANFSKWNLYASLGVNTNEPGGIGQILYEILKNKIDRVNREVEEFQAQYEEVYTQLKYMESRIRGASEQEARWLNAEYQSRRGEFNTLEELRDRVHLRARKISEAYDVINDLMLSLFPDYFQEVYDADMHDVKTGPYDDSPAGFRLLYKHGRSNTSQWTMIYHASEFIEALTSFFVAIEHQLRHDSRLEGLEQDLSEVITALVNQVRTQEFLESSFYRIAQARGQRMVKDPLHHMEQVETKPWAYISGATMDTLMSCYWRREEPPTETGRWVESPVELIVFLLDTLKKMEAKDQDRFLRESNRSMLIHSPTHAFLLKPGFSPFKEGWQKTSYTYTWVRDEWMIPKERFIDNLRLDQEMAAWVVNSLKEKLPQEFQTLFKDVFQRPPRGAKCYEMRQYIVETLQRSPSLRHVERYFLSIEKIDNFFYSNLPLFHRYQLQERVEKIFQEVMPERLQEIMEIYEEFSFLPGDQVISAEGLRNICQALVMLVKGVSSSEKNYPFLIAQASQQLGFALPQPIIFADSNWVKDYFGFLYSPGTGNLELWRLDRHGTSGYPLPSWKQWLDGSRQDRTWAIFSKLQEYSG